jgi:membrane protease YdiL (CAAX protease family)
MKTPTLFPMRLTSALFLVTVTLVIGLTSYLAWQPERSGSLSLWIWALVPSVILAALAAAWAVHDGLLLDWLAPRWGDATRGVFAALALVAGAWTFVRTSMPIGSAHEIWLVSLYGSVGDPRRLANHGQALVGVLVVGSLADEILWRGMVTQIIADRVGSRTAWVWAAGLYALAYFPTAWALGVGSSLNPVLVFAALATGLLFGAMARTFGRLLPSVIAHAFFLWGVLMIVPLWGQ